MTPPQIRVLLADDHALVRQGFRRILEDEPDIVVVGEAGGGAEAIALEQQLDPDVVVLDMAMPEINGLHAAIEIVRRRPDRRILMLSMHADPQVRPQRARCRRSRIHPQERQGNGSDRRGPDRCRGRHHCEP